MTSNNIYGRNAILLALKYNQVTKIYISKTVSSTYRKLIESNTGGVSIIDVEKSFLDEITNGVNHQGIVAEVINYNYSSVEEIFSVINKSEKKGLIVILDHIEDPHNFGAIIRSSVAAGVHGIIIPKNRQALVNSSVIKASSGNAYIARIAKVTNLSREIEELKKRGVWIYCLDSKGKSLYQTDFSDNVALVVGNEGAGISENIKKHSDGVISIPMDTNVESLNVSVACSIALYETYRQRNI